MANSILARDYTHIKVYRKWYWWWIYHRTLNTFGDDALVVLHRTRDHYRNLWGYNKVKLVLCWNDEEHIY